MMFIGLFLVAKVQFLNHDKKNKPRSGKPCLVVKMTISVCVNIKLLRKVDDKTEKQSNFEKKFFAFVS